MKMYMCFLMIIVFVSALPAQQINFYSSAMGGNVRIDPGTMQSSNSRAFALLADEGEQAVSHQLEGVRKDEDSLKNEAQKLTQKASGASGAGAGLAQLQAGIRAEEDKRTEMESQLTVIRQTKQKALQLMDQERKNYVHVVQLARAAAAAANRAQYQPTTHHDFYSPAYEQLKHINSTGNW